VETPRPGPPLSDRGRPQLRLGPYPAPASGLLEGGQEWRPRSAGSGRAAEDKYERARLAVGGDQGELPSLGFNRFDHVAI